MGGESNQVEEFVYNNKTFIPVTAQLKNETSGGFRSVIAVPAKYFSSYKGGCEGVSATSAAAP